MTKSDIWLREHLLYLKVNLRPLLKWLREQDSEPYDLRVMSPTATRLVPSREQIKLIEFICFICRK